MESKDMGGWYLPTHIVMEQLNQDASVFGRTKGLLSDVRTDFPEHLFTNVFRPGDLVREGRSFYRVLDDGTLQEIQEPSGDEQAAKQTQKEYLTIVGVICGVILTIFLIGAGYKRLTIGKAA